MYRGIALLYNQLTRSAVKVIIIVIGSRSTCKCRRSSLTCHMLTFLVRKLFASPTSAMTIRAAGRSMELWVHKATVSCIQALPAAVVAPGAFPGLSGKRNSDPKPRDCCSVDAKACATPPILTYRPIPLSTELFHQSFVALVFERLFYFQDLPVTGWTLE